jgi:hypothetical protein
MMTGVGGPAAARQYLDLAAAPLEASHRVVTA